MVNHYKCGWGRNLIQFTFKGKSIIFTLPETLWEPKHGYHLKFAHIRIFAMQFSNQMMFTTIYLPGENVDKNECVSESNIQSPIYSEKLLVKPTFPDHKFKQFVQKYRQAKRYSYIE